jgi:hypothetical protein
MASLPGELVFRGIGQGELGDRDPTRMLLTTAEARGKSRYVAGS